jgi:cytochrome c-type biogenesis protein CcsB
MRQVKMRKEIFRTARRVLLSLSLVFISILARADVNALKYLPVQDGGRLKPYDTFAREALQLVYGSEKFQDRPALEIVTTWMLIPEHWDAKKIVQINHRGLKDSLRLEIEQTYFSPDELVHNDRLGLVLQELQAKHDAKEKLDPYYQAVQRLQNQLGLFTAIKSAQAVRVAPPKYIAPTGGDVGVNQAATGRMTPKDIWRSVAELDGDLQRKFGVIARSFVHSLPDQGTRPEPTAVDTSEIPPLEQAVADFKDAARAENPQAYASDRDMQIEVFYNSLHPFRWAWVFYLASALLMGVAWHKPKYPKLYIAAWGLALVAFAMHILGFVLRVYLTGHPPVSNMYESVVWVSWGTVMFSMIFEFLHRRRFILMAGTAVATLCLIVANMAPVILDESMQPLEPVLRSNLWLTIHVLTITISYSAYFLAFGLGDVGLYYILIGDSANSERVRAISQSVYRAIQVGVVFLATGIVLGGVWADYSWGRFWGWDPKETWAFIALLGYLAILHGRLAGWLQTYGLIASAVVSFSLVMMAWYGVNFVLGAGLHTYGFGAGGVQYVGGFVLLHLIYVAYVSYVHSARKKLAKTGG